VSSKKLDDWSKPNVCDLGEYRKQRQEEGEERILHDTSEIQGGIRGIQEVSSSKVLDFVHPKKVPVACDQEAAADYFILREARRLFSRCKYKKAIPLLKELFEQDRDPYYSFMYGVCLFMEGNDFEKDTGLQIAKESYLKYKSLNRKRPDSRLTIRMERQLQELIQLIDI